MEETSEVVRLGLTGPKLWLWFARNVGVSASWATSKRGHIAPDIEQPHTLRWYPDFDAVMDGPAWAVRLASKLGVKPDTAGYFDNQRARGAERLGEHVCIQRPSFTKVADEYKRAHA